MEDALAKGKDEAACRDTAFRFLNAIGGDLLRFEDAIRAIYAGDPAGYDYLSADWPADVRAHGRKLAWPGDDA